MEMLKGIVFIKGGLGRLSDDGKHVEKLQIKIQV
jgi:hypothetical protein